LNWFNEVIQLDAQRRKTIVWSYVHNHDETGFNELCNGLNEDPKTSMSRNTVSKILSILMGEGLIAKKVKSKQKHIFTAQVHRVRLEEKNLKRFDRILSKYEKKLKKLQKLLAEHDMDIADKLTALRRFAPSFWFLDFELYTIDEISTEKERQIRIQRLNNLRKRFFDVAWNDSEDKEVYSLLLDDLQQIASGYEADYDADFEDW